MTFRANFLFVFVLLVSTSIAQHPQEIEWQRTLGGSGFELDRSAIQETSDGGFVVAGRTASNDGDVSGNHGNYDYWIAKLGSSGALLWQKTFGGSDHDIAKSMQQTNDGGFIVAGSTSSIDGDVSGNNGLFDFWVIKLDNSGTLLWEKTYGGSDIDMAEAIQETSDGGFVVTGYTSSNDGDVSGNHGATDFWVIKLDSSGTLLWQKTLGGSLADGAESVQQTTDGGFVVAGHTYSSDGDVSGSYLAMDYWIVKLDSLGTLLWQKCLGGNSYDFAESIQQTIDGGFVVAGHTYSDDGDVSGYHGLDDYWVIKLDGSGNLLWQKAIGGSGADIARSVQQTNDGGFVVVGFTNSSDGDVLGNRTSTDYWIVKLDSTGAMLWQKAMGGSGDDRATGVHETSDGDLIVVGQSSSNDGDVSGQHGIPDYWVVKLTADFALLGGSVFADLNNNLIQDGAELGSTWHMITNLNNGQPSFADALGRFSVPTLDSGITMIAPDLLANYNTQPSTHSANFATLQQQTDSLNDFAMQPLGSINDLQALLTPVGFFRPGFPAQYMINYKNVGTTSISPELVLFPDPLLSFDSSSVTPTALFTDSLKWQLPVLVPLEAGQIIVHLTVDANAVIGSILSSSTRIDPVLGDADIHNNWADWDVTVQGSLDPNDILVDRSTVQLSELNPTAPELSYIIRFQNTGTDTAFTVRIENGVPENADLSSFQFVSASHPVQINYLQHVNRFEYTFNNILLADSNTNEAASHGFIRYKMKPKSTLMLGDSVLNTAGIDFDFNQPVITNTAFTVIESTTGIEDDQESVFSLSPNPSNGLVTIQLNEAQTGTISITDATGREVVREALNWSNTTLDLRTQPNGVYLISLNTDAGVYTKKLVLKR